MDGSASRSTHMGSTSTLFRLIRSSTISALIQVGKYCCGLRLVVFGTGSSYPVPNSEWETSNSQSIKSIDDKYSLID